MRQPRALHLIIAVIAMVLAWQFLYKPVAGRIVGFNEITWRGEKFKLKRRYFDYEQYKSDIDQLAPAEIERLKHFMLSINVPKTADSETDLRHSLAEMRFPGFGSSYAGSIRDEQGRRYILNEYELPETQEQRTLLYRADADGTCHLVLDGVSVDHKNDHMIAMGEIEVKVEGGKLKHLFNGKVYREIAIQASP